jgi:predicted DNA-binding transcriptional regulator AlpA
MAGPRISELYKYMTLPQAAQRLGMHPAKLRRRLRDGIFPRPTFINEYGLKFFDEAWLSKAKTILTNSFEAKS